MKKSYIEHMKNYRTKQKQVKAIKYQEGMEDGWMIIFPDISEMDGYIDKLFFSKDEAEKFIGTDEFNEYEYGNQNEITKIVPVLLTLLSDDEVEYYESVVSKDGNKYYFDAVDEDMWIVMDEEGDILSCYDFFKDYEAVKDESAKIGYDRDIEELFLELNNIRVAIDETEVATVEKLLDGFGIPFTERLGQAFWR